MQEHTHVSDKVRPAVDVHRCSGDISVAPRRQIGGDGSDLLGEPGAAEIAWLMEVVVYPGHDVVRVGGIESVGGEDVFEILGGGGSIKSKRAYTVAQDAFLGR